MIERRNILAGGFAALGAPMLLTGAGKARGSDESGGESRHWVAIGRQVRSSLGPERAAALEAAAENIGRAGIESLSAADYRAGRTFIVSGFLLSHTEAAFGLKALRAAGGVA